MCGQSNVTTDTDHLFISSLFDSSQRVFTQGKRITYCLTMSSTGPPRNVTTETTALIKLPASKRARTSAAQLTSSGKRLVLPEHEYSRGLSRVIQQQYFPDLPQLKEALGESSDHDTTDDSITIETESQHIDPSSTTTVTEYHARVTSEDNADFDQIQRRESQERQAARVQKALEYAAPKKPRERPDSAFALASDAFDPSPHRPPMADRAAIEQFATQQNALMFLPSASNDVKQVSHNSTHLLNNGKNDCLNETNPPSQQTDANLMPPPASIHPYIEPSATRFPSQKSIILQKQPHQRPRAWSTSLESDLEGDDHSSISADSASDLDATPLRSVASERRQYQEHSQSYRMVEDRRSGFAATPLTRRDQAAANALERLQERSRLAAIAQRGRKASSKRASASTSTSRRRSTTSSSLSSRLQQSTGTGKQPSSRLSNSFGSALRASYLRPPSSSQT